MATSAQAEAQPKPRRQIAESVEVVAGAPPKKGMEVTKPRRECTRLAAERRWTGEPARAPQPTAAR
jgi:hypothetical protein